MFTKITFASLFGIVIVCCALSPRVFGSPQQLTFFQTIDCTGENDTITVPRDDLITTRMTNATSVHILGLWKIGANLREGTSGFSLIHYNSNPPEGRCVNKKEMDPNSDDYAFYYADRLGGQDMATSQITFYTEQTFIGLRYTINEESVAKVGPRPFVMSSYIHLSNDEWTVYPEQDFKGDPTLIRPSSNNTDSYSYNSETTLIVGSVKRGNNNNMENGSETLNAALRIMILPFILIVASILN